MKNKHNQHKRKKVTDMTAVEAKSFFLKPTSYVSLLPSDLPRYFDFAAMINKAKDCLINDKKQEVDLKSIANLKELSSTSKVNYTLLMNKDGRYDWRPIQIIHPVIYVDLVNFITNNWKKIILRFNQFAKNKNILCISIPVESTKTNNDKEETILNWWENLEQASIKFAMNYKYCIKTDITNCYGSIYTHSISWALMGKENAKKNRNSHQFENQLDKKIQTLQSGQTNGIPQGGILFDFIAEIVLGYADLLLSNSLREADITDYQVLRYRDDYRIFSNQKETVERITKYLSSILADLNMHFNSKKTGITSDIIGSAIKIDKIYWTKKEPILFTKMGEDYKKQKIKYNLSEQKHLWQIYELAKRFPNSGSVKKALSQFFSRIEHNKSLANDYEQQISIITNIIIESPNSIPLGVAIISQYLSMMNDNTQVINDFIDSFLKKIKDIPNTNFIDIWLQRLSIINNPQKIYSDDLCKKIIDSNQNIWNSSWLDKGFNESSLVRQDMIENLTIKIPKKDVALFDKYPF